MCLDANIPEPDIDFEEVDFGIYGEELIQNLPPHGVNPDLALARRMQRHIAATHFAD